MLWRLVVRWLRSLAEVGRRLAAALDDAGGWLEARSKAPSPIPQALLERFPGAPEHWLRDIAARSLYNEAELRRTPSDNGDLNLEPPPRARRSASVSRPTALRDADLPARSARDEVVRKGARAQLVVSTAPAPVDAPARSAAEASIVRRPPARPALTVVRGRADRIDPAEGAPQGEPPAPAHVPLRVWSAPDSSAARDSHAIPIQDARAGREDATAVARVPPTHVGAESRLRVDERAAAISNDTQRPISSRRADVGAFSRQAHAPDFDGAQSRSSRSAADQSIARRGPAPKPSATAPKASRADVSRVSRALDSSSFWPALPEPESSILTSAAELARIDRLRAEQERGSWSA